jgi:hypothetical protein
MTDFGFDLGSLVLQSQGWQTGTAGDTGHDISEAEHGFV